MFASDLPGEWSEVLVGAYWPGTDALNMLVAGATSRHRSENQLHGYADQLACINKAHLCGQEGATAAAARFLFTRGEHAARATAERNAAKRRSYESARQRIIALRADLAQIAEDGNTAIRRIQESSAPREAQVAGIMEVIATAHTQARGRTAENAGHLLTEIQTVLDAQGVEVSARAFAASYGIDPAPPMRSPDAPTLTQQVTTLLESPAGSAGGGECAGAGSSVGPAHHAVPPRDGPDRPAAPDRFAGAEGALLAGTTGLAAAAGSTIGAALTGGPDEVPHPVPTPAPPESPTAGYVLPNPAAAPASGVPGSGLRPALAAPPAAAVSAAAGVAVAHTPAPPVPPGAAGALHPSNAAAVAQSALVRRASTAVTAPAERASAVAVLPRPTEHLTALLAAVARQLPELRWAVGERTDGHPVLATDLAGGWIPPQVGIPAGLQLLEPGRRHGDLAALLGDCTAVASYAPGQPISPDSGAVPMSAAAREVGPADELGWELAQATRCRDGLPRLAHTLARAATTGTGWLDAEVALLHEHLDAVAARVVAGYPALDRTEVGNWQLLATIDALISGENATAAYHFAWFQANSPAAQR